MPPLLSPTPGCDCHAVLFDVPKLSQILQALHNVIRSPALFSKFIQKLSLMKFAAIPSWWRGFWISFSRRSLESCRAFACSQPCYCVSRRAVRVPALPQLPSVYRMQRSLRPSSPSFFFGFFRFLSFSAKDDIVSVDDGFDCRNYSVCTAVGIPSS